MGRRMGRAPPPQGGASLPRPNRSMTVLPGVYNRLLSVFSVSRPAGSKRMNIDNLALSQTGEPSA